MGGRPRYAGEKDPHLSYLLFPNQGWVGFIQVVGQSFCSLCPSLFLYSSTSNALISSQTKICVQIAFSCARLIKSQKATIIIPFTISCWRRQLSWAPVGSIEYRETVLRRLLFQRTGFLFKKFTWHFPMDPNTCLYYPSQPGVTQTFPQVSLTVRRLLSQWGGEAVPQGILTATFSAGPVHGSPATPSGGREKGHIHKRGGCLYVSISGGLLTAWALMSKRRARLWVLAWVYIPCGDLATSVIHTVTLGLAY
jgi:hypothetical protein